jgi:4-amino-4-deoxy-L-arabinose transferase-like glycosyltransferase
MEACLTHEAPFQEKDPVESRSRAESGARWIRIVLAATILVGLGWRALRYVEQFPIWGDEAMLLLNILDRDYVGLTHHLRYSQVAPLLFLWLEKAALLTWGSAEWSVHLFPMLAGLFAFLFFWRSCRAAFSPLVAGLAIGILAVSYYPVRHATEVKPYAFDLLAAVVFAGLALEQLRHPRERRWLAALVVMTPLAIFSSYPSVFVGAAVSLVLLPLMRSASWSQRGLFALFNLALLGSFLVHYGMVGHHQIDAEEARRTREFLHNYWKDAFPPDAWQDWPLWLLQVHTGNMLAYPIGANHGGSTLSFLLVLLGSVVLWRQGQRSVLALCWLPFALNLVAAILDKYPFGGSARITLHLAPFICILMAHGAAAILDWIRSPAWRTRTHLAFCLFLLGCGTVGIVRDLLKPYKTEHDRETRHVVADLARQVGADEPVLLCHRVEREVLAELTWYFRTEIPSLHWLADESIPQAGTKSFWLVLCSHGEPSVSEVVAAMGRDAQEWKVLASEVRHVPPENAKMADVYCRWVRLGR